MSLSILNVGEGDTKLTFDKSKPAEIERTRRIVTDMLRLGYAIMVYVGKTPKGKPRYRRAIDFDPAHDEYIVKDVPAEADALTPRRGIMRGSKRIPASGTPAVAVARSAGGMSAAADSVEMHNLERFDGCAETRNKLRALAAKADQWAGLPMDIDDADLVIHPSYSFAKVYAKPKLPAPDDGSKIRNVFYSTHKRCDIATWTDAAGKVQWGLTPRIHHFAYDIQTMGCSIAWGIQQESEALQLLANLIPHHAFKKYLLTGMFLETSERSGVTYCFRRLKPTVAIKEHNGEMRIITALCAHPIAYYSGSWAGAMCPTDDVVAHLMFMRGDEALYWRRCNQHRAGLPEAGL